MGYFALTFVLAAFSDVLLGLQPAVWLLLAIWAGKQRRNCLWAFAGSCAGALVVMGAPGNAARIAYAHPAPFFTALGAALFYAPRVLAQTVTAAPILFILLMVAAWATAPQTPNPADRRRAATVALKALASVFTINTAFLFTSFFASGWSPPDRAYLFPIMLDLGGLTVAAYQIGRWRGGTIPVWLVYSLLVCGLALTLFQAITGLWDYAGRYDLRADFARWGGPAYSIRSEYAPNGDLSEDWLRQAFNAYAQRPLRW